LSTVAVLLYTKAMRAMGRTTDSGRNDGLLAALRAIYTHMSARRRKQCLAVMVLMLIGGFAELGTIGSLITFLTVLARTDVAPPTWIAGLAGNHLLLAAALLFIGLAFAAGAIRLQLNWMTQNFAFGLAHELSLEAHRRVLLQPYSYHVDVHSSTLLSRVDIVEVLVLEVLLPLMQAAIGAATALIILAGLIYIEPVTATIAAIAFLLLYVLLSTFTAERLARNSQTVGTGYRERTKIIQESLGGIRDVILDGSQAAHVTLFERVNGRLAQARATTAFIAGAPRFILESVGIAIIAGLALFASQRAGGLAHALPTLGALALGAQRLLPQFQSVYNGWSAASGHWSSVEQVLSTLELPAPAPKAGKAPLLALNSAIRFDRVSFTYPSRRSAAIEQVTLELPAKSMIALTGRTGAGKSTFIDLLMALLQPTAGRILIDGVALNARNRRAWQRSIAHVPQSIFLADTTIAHNIALSVPQEQPDMDRIIAAARRAQLDEFVSSLPDGYSTVVGERGVRLSGGQRQRLGIARAIYKDVPVMVLDEATSALDDLTERDVMRGIEALRCDGRTIIIVAHRHSTISHCDLVVKLDDGRLVEVADNRAGSRAARMGSSG
jgi:ABC-type multidrug transport system fused ATPase/permease subunit